MKERVIQCTVKIEDEGRLDRLVAHLTEFSRTRTRGLLLHGGVEVNGVLTADAGTVLKSGDAVSIRFDPARQYRDAPKVPVVELVSKKPASARSFQVVYCDDSLVVVNKEAGLLTVPTDKRESQNLLDLLGKSLNPHRRSKLGLVHRLDRETSGLLVFGQDEAIASELIKQFADRKPERVYLAIVKGDLREDEATLRSYLQTDKGLNQRSNQSGQGDLAITHYKVLERFKSATLIEVRLETGRRNQIRVHFAELGHPVLGDTRYEKEKAMHPGWPFKRLALHARVLGFTHPVSGDILRFEQEQPREFRQFRDGRSKNAPLMGS